ncbi:hypothetical protein BCV70DRAFT_199972 [Testicularia cyperi]|uniref:Vps52-domain-containing protein n=1 Tax=Testicularia cyperi TaxID=1882483 RepID=A0A317XQY2_9BASI|nr:hypothetical protein BCV70DRAFT_199972 [Testicularia cyperi]
MIDDAKAEELIGKAELASRLSNDRQCDVQQLYTSALAAKSASQAEQDEKYLSLLPTFLSLHSQATQSKQLLGSLESFLSTFQTDLSALSTHIEALQTTSQGIDARLDSRRHVEADLATFLSSIALSPRIVDLFFETEPETRPDLWNKAVKQLEKVLEATSPGAAAAGTDAQGPDDITSSQAVQEVRQVAESSKHVVSAKLRNFLIAPHAAIKASVTTNVQVLQTSVLLKHHRPLYGFLARQNPRVAIDVQRSYVGAARLYFETAFRRYARSLGLARKRWAEPSGTGSIVDPRSSSYGAAGSGAVPTSMAGLQASMSSITKGAGLGFLSGGGAASSGPGTGPATPSAISRVTSQDGGSAAGLSDNEAMNSAFSDPWIFHPARIQYSKLEGPATVLGYMADDPAFKACPENLFRSLSLVLLDNACSEYTFLVRFFENAAAPAEAEEDGATGTTKTTKTGTPQGQGKSGTALGPDESASAADENEASRHDASSAAAAIAITGAGAVDANDVDIEAEVEPTVVQLSTREQLAIKNRRGAVDEIFKQIFEPSISTWNSFVRGLVLPAMPFLSLLSMVMLNERTMALLRARGCCSPNSSLESTLMGFKLLAYPHLKRALDEQIAALAKLNGNKSAASTNMATSHGSAGSASASASVWGILGSVTGSVSSHSSASLTHDLALTIAARYASLFTKATDIMADLPDQAIYSSLARMRSEIKILILTSPNINPRSAVIQSILLTIENANLPNSIPQLHDELDFWSRALVSARQQP